MRSNPVIDALARPLRLAVVGGGPGSNIGATHRTAARIDDRYVLVAGVLSSDPGRSLLAGKEVGLARPYARVLELLDQERAHPEAAEVVAVMTPNDSHRDIVLAALDRGFDVICDKPLANTLADAMDVVEKVESTGLIFCLAQAVTIAAIAGSNAFTASITIVASSSIPRFNSRLPPR